MQAARHRWHSRWGKSSQLVWSQCCTLPRCFQGLPWTDLRWWKLLQAKVLLHTKDGERLLVFSPCNLPQRLAHTSVDLREMRWCPWMPTMGCLPPQGTLSTFPSYTGPDKPVTHEHWREAPHPFLTDAAGYCLNQESLPSVNPQQKPKQLPPGIQWQHIQRLPFTCHAGSPGTRQFTWISGEQMGLRHLPVAPGGCTSYSVFLQSGCTWRSNGKANRSNSPIWTKITCWHYLWISQWHFQHSVSPWLWNWPETETSQKSSACV